jgi:exosortase/archaeosortase family protein
LTILDEAPACEGGRSSRRVEIRDRHVMLLFAACVALATLWQSGLSSTGLSPGFPLDAGECLALFALFSVISRMDDDTLLSRLELLAIAAVGMAFALPSFKAASVPVLIVSFMFIARRDPRLASIGQLLLALIWYRVLGKLIFDLIAPVVLSIETTIVAKLTLPFGTFTQVGSKIISPSGFTIFIEPPCSAFHNITVASLIWLGLIKTVRLKFSSSDWWALAAMIGATIILNTVRIALMAQSEEMWEYWHNGHGVAIASTVILASILTIPVLSDTRMSWTSRGIVG